MCVVGRVHETVPTSDDVILNNMRGAASGASPSSVSIKVGRTRVTVTSLVSNNVTVRYNEASHGVVPGTTTNATNATNSTNSTNSANAGIGVGAIGGTVPGGRATGVALSPSTRMSPPSNMDTSEGPTVAPVKAETPEGQLRATTSASTVTGPVGSGNSLFAGIASSNKRPRPDDWLAPNSPSSPQGPLPNQHLIYTTPQQQLPGTTHQQPGQQQTQQQQQQPSQQGAQQPPVQPLQQQPQQQQQPQPQPQQQQPAPPMAHSTPITQTQAQQQPPPNNNGYASPMSSGSYDPYSPNGKIGRDDLSPPSSLNGYSADSCDAKKKKGPTPRQQEELCLVCGDRASGYHYNALTCEGCKGFFRRSITKNAVYQCKYGNNCEIDMYMRRKCQECRLKKCLTTGMRPECVVPEYQCAVKRKEKKAQKVGDKDKPNSTTMNGSPGSISGMGSEQMGVKMEPAEPECLSVSGSSSAGTTPGSHNGVKPVSSEQEELIHRLVYYQNEYEQPSEEDVKRITNQPTDGEDPSDIRFRHITEITILTVQLIVEYAKRLPGFDQLLREDQIALLKACSSEVMMLRMARKYDVQTDSIVFANNQPYTRDSYSLAGMGETIEDLLHFCRHMYNMKVNNAEYALLTAIVIFSERPNLLEAWKVEKIQEIYLEALKAYVDNRRKPRAGTEFAKLLSVLTELRTLGNQNSEMCFSLKLKNKKLPPFLAEIWDVMP